MNYAMSVLAMVLLMLTSACARMYTGPTDHLAVVTDQNGNARVEQHSSVFTAFVAPWRADTLAAVTAYRLQQDAILGAHVEAMTWRQRYEETQYQLDIFEMRLYEVQRLGRQRERRLAELTDQKLAVSAEARQLRAELSVLSERFEETKDLYMQVLDSLEKVTSPTSTPR